MHGFGSKQLMPVIMAVAYVKTNRHNTRAFAGEIIRRTHFINVGKTRNESEIQRRRCGSRFARSNGIAICHAPCRAALADGAGRLALSRTRHHRIPRLAARASARARLQSEVTKLKQSNQTLNDENAKVKEMLDQQMETERTKTTEMETRVKTLETASNEWTTVQANVGGTGYRPAAATAAAAGTTTATEEPAINVASSVRVFRLDMNLAKLADYPEYTADITGPAGQKPSLIKVSKAANGVAILIASSNLTDGKYVVKLSGKKDGISKELGKGYSVNLAFPK